jgi:phage protein D
MSKMVRSSFIMPDQTDTTSHIMHGAEPSATVPKIPSEDTAYTPSTATPAKADPGNGKTALRPSLLEEIEKWRLKDDQFREARRIRQRAPDREADRKAYAERIMQEEGRAVRSYLPSTPERRQLQKAASRARRKAMLTPEEIEEQRRKDRERKAFMREMKRECDYEEMIRKLDKFLDENPGFISDT